ncbi:hypothetical protein ACFLZ1_04050, partial [Patescibacteria group bacterium]
MTTKPAKKITTFIKKALKTRKKYFFLVATVFTVVFIASLATFLVLNKDKIFKPKLQEPVKAVIYPQAQIKPTKEKQIFKSTENPTFKLKLGEKGKKKKVQTLVSEVIAQNDPIIKTTVSYLGNEPMDVLSNNVVLEKTNGDEYEITIPKPKHFRPGKYELIIRVEDDDGTYQEITQDFTWGVLAINTNKATFQPGEKAEIYFGVVDEMGSTVCDASLWLTITSPDGKITNLTTKDGSIEYGGFCERDNVTYIPDYSTSFKTSTQGNYQLELKAETKQGTFEIADVFKVDINIPFDIERSSATRINPVADYDVYITVTANTDFQGQIKEELPIDFIIENGNFNRQEINKTIPAKILVWDVNLHKGDTLELSYTYDSPDNNPEFYLLGPIQFINSKNKTLFYKEARQWQVAVDGDGQVILFWDSGTAPTGWTIISDGVGEAYYNVYPRGATTYNTSVGGTQTHDHTVSYSSGSDQPTPSGDYFDEGNDGVYVGLETHIHNSINSSNITSESNDPDYRILNVIRSNDADPTTIPNGTIAIFDTPSLPTDWDAYNDNNGYYIKGGSAVEIGGTAVHNHGVGVTTGGPSASSNNLESAAATADTENHTHAGSGTTVDTNNDPSYINIILGKANQDTSVAAGMIAMFDATAPSGWNSVSEGGGDFNGNFMVGATAYGGTGGGGTHAHSNLSITLQASADKRADIDDTPGQGGAANDHTHANFVVSFGTAPHLPVYRDTIIAKKESVLEGTVYTGTGTTYNCSTTNLTIETHVNGGTGQTGICTAANGSYSIAGLTVSAQGDVITAFIQEENEKATTITRAAGADQQPSDMNLYIGKVVLRHDDAGPLTNTNIDQFDGDDDSDIHVSVSGTSLISQTNTEINIAVGETYDPGGTITVNDNGGVLHVDDNAFAYIDTATSSLGEGVTVDAGAYLYVDVNSYLYGSMVINGTLDNSAGTPTISAMNTASIVGSGTKDFYNLTIGTASTAANTNISVGITAANNLTISSSSGATAPSGNIIIGNNYSNSGGFTHSSGAVIMTATDGGNTLAGTMTSGSAFNTLEFNGASGSWSFSNDATLASDFTIINGGVSAPNFGTLTIGGNYSNSGSFTNRSSIVTMSATDTGNTVSGNLDGNHKFFNLTFDGVSGEWTISANLAVENNCTLTNGTVDFGSSTGTIGNNLNNAAGTGLTAPSAANLTIGNSLFQSGSFTHNSGTVVMNATDGGNTLGGTMTGNNSFNNLEFNGASGSWSFSNNAAMANNFTITNGGVTAPSSGTLTIGNNYSNSDSFTHNSSTVTLNATDGGNTLGGTMTGNSSFNNLTFNGGGGSWSFSNNA